MQFPRGKQQLGFVNRGDPNSGFFMIMMAMLAFQLLGNRQLPPTDQIIAVLVSFIIAVTIHECMHAIAAYKLGDPTAKNMGRITLNPIAHFDPFGFFGMVMIALGYNFIGWGKPVPVNLNNLNGKGITQKKRQFGLIALAGPISNVVMAAMAAGVIRLIDTSASDDVMRWVLWFFYVNVLLAAFNAIPIPPLDGYKILTAILPSYWYPVLAPLERYGFMVLFLLFFLGSQLNSSLTAPMTAPITNLLFRMLP